MAHPPRSHNDLSDPVIETFVHDLRDALGPRLREVRLFGFRARGETGEESDYDVCVVVDSNVEEAERGKLRMLHPDDHAESRSVSR